MDDQSAANQAVGLARLGVTVDMVGAVGNDSAGRMMRDHLMAAGVLARHLAVVGEYPTGLALVMVDGDGDNAIVEAALNAGAASWHAS